MNRKPLVNPRSKSTLQPMPISEIQHIKRIKGLFKRADPGFTGYGLVSIIMPTYNRKEKIAASIQSVIAQSYSNWELIIVDDKSTDNTVELINMYMEKDERIRYFYNKGRKGVPSARNCGISQACGEYIAFLDSDDQWLAYHLRDSINILETYNQNVCFALWYEMIENKRIEIDKLEKEIYTTGFRNFQSNTRDNVIIFRNTDFYKNLLEENFYCYHINTMVFRKSILGKTGLFDFALRANDDIDFIFRIIIEYGFCLIKNYHFEYHYGQDCLYAFVNRRVTGIEELKKNPLIVKKITHHGRHKIKHYKKQKKYVRNSAIVDDKKKWISLINRKIAKKSFTLGFLNGESYKLQSLKYYLVSLLHKYNKQTLTAMLKSLVPFLSRNLPVEKHLLDIN